MAKTLRVPSLPVIRSGDAELDRFLDAVRQVIHAREGMGDPLDRLVTMRDIRNSNIGQVSIQGQPQAPYAGPQIPPLPGGIIIEPIDYTVPPALTGLTADAAMQNIILSWDFPPNSNYAAAEVWRSESDSIGAAVHVGTSAGTVYIDPVGVSSTVRYYWIRQRSDAGVLGPYNATAGVSATTGQVEGGDLADDSVGPDELQDLAVTNPKLANLAVSNTKISDNAISTPKIQVFAVDSFRIDTNAITSAKIQASAVIAEKIAAAAVIADKIAAAAVIAGKIATNAVTSNTIVANAITSTKIDADAVTATHMAANSITAANAALANLAVTTAKIADLAVSTLKIQDQAVTIPISVYTEAQRTFGTAWVTVQQASITSSGAPIHLDFSCALVVAAQSSGTSFDFVYLRILRGATPIWEEQVVGVTDRWSAAGYENGYTTVAVGKQDTPGAGTYTYYVQMQSVVGLVLSGAYARSLLLLETKK